MTSNSSSDNLTVPDNEYMYPYYELGKVPMDFLSFLQTEAKKIRKLQINWLPYLQNQTITREQCIFLTLYQEAEDHDSRENIINFFGLRSFECLIAPLTKVTSTDALQKIAITIDDMLYEDAKRIKGYFKTFKETEKKGEKPFKPFLDLLNHEDEFVKNVSSRIISKLITYKFPRLMNDDLEEFLNWIKENLREENDYVHSVLRCLQRMSKHKIYREHIMSCSIFASMLTLVGLTIHHQVQYQICFCIWMNTFDGELLEKLHKYSLISILGKVLCNCPPEYAKLHRIILACFRNLVEKPKEHSEKMHNSLMIVQAGVIPYLNILEMRTHLFKDEEFADDFKTLDTALQSVIMHMTSFGEYCVELKSGKLDWSVVHTSAKFWKENAYKLNEKKYELLKILINHLKTSKNPTILSVACYDLGQYMKNYARGRKVIMELDGKDILIELLTHKHPAVKFNALKALQILMLNNCHILEKDLKGKGRVKEITL